MVGEWGDQNSVLQCQFQVALLEQKLKEYCLVDYKVKVYPGQVHGFAQCKPEDMKPRDVPYIEEARIDIVEWLNRYLMF
ncbi:UNVERIFIED_CONTAM: hypothetical protein K2H54_004059 [Gekko kuhli]